MQETKTVEGLFLLEVNAPMRYYSRYDQIEQESAVLKFDTLNNAEVHKYYSDVFVIFPNNELQSIKNRMRSKGFYFNDTAIHQLSRILQNSVNDYVVNKTSNFFEIGKDNFYLKFYATISYIDIGKKIRLVPKSKQYECCYSNIKKRIKICLISDVKNIAVVNNSPN